MSDPDFDSPPGPRVPAGLIAAVLAGAAGIVVLVLVLSGGKGTVDDEPDGEIPAEVKEYARQVVAEQVPDKSWEVVSWRVLTKSGKGMGNYILKVRTKGPPPVFHSFAFTRGHPYGDPRRPPVISWRTWPND